MDGLKPGRIVYYVLTMDDDVAISRRRTTGEQIHDAILASKWPNGAQAHIGNPVLEGDIFPAMVVRVIGDDVNLKVMLDGTDVLWVEHVPFNADKAVGTWHWMFEGQSTRYQPDRVEKVSS